MTVPKVVVLILKHTMSLRLYKLPGPALIQADLDYQKADVDQKIHQYIGASEGPSAELDKAFIMDIEIGSVRLPIVTADLFSPVTRVHVTKFPYLSAEALR